MVFSSEEHAAKKFKGDSEPSKEVGEGAVRLIKAIDFACKKHIDQRRKGANKAPYINHPVGVMNILAQEGHVRDERILMVLASISLFCIRGGRFASQSMEERKKSWTLEEPPDFNVLVWGFFCRLPCSMTRWRTLPPLLMRLSASLALKSCKAKSRSLGFFSG